MGDFDPVIIRKSGGHFDVTQRREILLRVPESLFSLFDADTVFPPAWRALEPSHPVRRLFWNPDSREYLMAGLEAHPARLSEGFGASPYRSFLQGFWLPQPPVVLLRPYWNPADPYDAFDRDARQRSFDAQMRFLGILARLMPPGGWTAILNAVDPYLEALGVNPAGVPGDPEAIPELSLTPPAPLDESTVRKALEVLTIEHAGSCFPVIREGFLLGVQTLCLPALYSVEALLQSLGISCQQGPFRPH